MQGYIEKLIFQIWKQELRQLFENFCQKGWACAGYFKFLHSAQVIPGKQISRAKNYISGIIAKEEMIRRVSPKVTLWEDLRPESFEVYIFSLGIVAHLQFLPRTFSIPGYQRPRRLPPENFCCQNICFGNSKAVEGVISKKFWGGSAVECL